MRQISSCVYGGGELCKRQGGSGEASHASGYVHPYPTIQETGKPAGDPVQPLDKSLQDRTVKLEEIEDFFDDDFAKSVLGISFDSAIHAVDIVKKSLYNFELDDREGVLEFLELLPILDSLILIDVAGEIWPGYPAQDQHVDLLRMEIKGYMMDYLEGHGEEESEDTEVGEEGPEEIEGLEEGAAGGATGESPTPPAGTARAEGVEAEGSADVEPTPEQGDEA